MDNFIEIYEDYIKVREATKKGYAIAREGDSINLEHPNSKTRRGRVGYGIANKLTCSCNQGVVEVNEIKVLGNYSPSNHNASRIISIDEITPTVMENHGTVTAILENNLLNINKEEVYMVKPKLVGGIGEINFGKQFRQGNRIYDANEIAMCLMAQPVGGTGGFSYLYQIKESKGDRIMWENKLEKLNFNMDEIRVFDVFAGIGSLHQSLKDLGVPVRITNLSEIDIDAIISYAAGHIENFKDLEFEYPSDTEMKEWLMARNIGYSYEKNKSSVPRMKKEKLKLAYKASVLLKNLGDIAKIDYDKIEDFDLMNFSFSCTDISNAGKQKGMKNEDGTPTRSGLYIYGIKAIRAKRPKYIMIENVKGLIQKKFIDDFYSIVEELKEVGYNCYYPTKTDKKQNKIPICLNAKDFGIPQNRERIFVICIRKDIDDGVFEFPIGKDQGIRLKDVLENEVDEKYYLSPEVQNKIYNWRAYQRPFENVLGKNSTSPTLTARGAGEYHSGMILVGNGLEDNVNLENDKRIICERRYDKGLRFFKNNICGTIRTIDAGGDKRVIENESEVKIRKLTPLECWRLMGFPDENFYKAKELGISDSQLYKQAGNSIVTNCLYYIFKNVFSKYIVREF